MEWSKCDAMQLDGSFAGRRRPFESVVRRIETGGATGTAILHHLVCDVR